MSEGTPQDLGPLPASTQESIRRAEPQHPAHAAIERAVGTVQNLQAGDVTPLTPDEAITETAKVLSAQQNEAAITAAVRAGKLDAVEAARAKRR